jgi:hypothetical protein
LRKFHQAEIGNLGKLFLGVSAISLPLRFEIEV